MCSYTYGSLISTDLVPTQLCFTPATIIPASRGSFQFLPGLNFVLSESSVQRHIFEVVCDVVDSPVEDELSLYLSALSFPTFLPFLRLVAMSETAARSSD